MAANGITVLKHNVPWGPFSRAQIDDGLARGDYTLQYLAHAPGLTEWLPLGEVLDLVARRESAAAPSLPPVPPSRELPPIPPRSTPPPSPPVMAQPPPKKVEPPLAPKPLAPPVIPEPEPAATFPDLQPAPFFSRTIAFLVDCGILFLPLVLLLTLGFLIIETPTLFRHESAQAVAEQKAQLWISTKRMAAYLAIGCGWLYAAWWESSPRQATIGKRWMGLRVVDDRGERLSFLRATGRYAAKYLSALPCFLGFIMALFSSRGRTLHDRLAGTYVVRE